MKGKERRPAILTHHWKLNVNVSSSSSSSRLLPPQQHRTILLRLCQQLTVDMLLMRRLHLRHMRQRRRRITQLIRRRITKHIRRRQLHKIRIRGSIRCRIIIQLQVWHPEESLIRDRMGIMPRILRVQILGLPRILLAQQQILEQ